MEEATREKRLSFTSAQLRELLEITSIHAATSFLRVFSDAASAIERIAFCCNATARSHACSKYSGRIGSSNVGLDIT